MNIPNSRSRISAVLGPTNTGKTYYAMERMLAHPSGMIGFPLRLLARENYDRAVAIKGQDKVALVTGEEKILPPGARYYLCTVEAMPLDRSVDFLAIDEIQMCADPDRGHVFTDRLLHARGISETVFLGADAMQPLIRQLVPGVDFQSRPRLSRLSYAGQVRISRLKPRSAIVAFTANDVYAIAELVRRQRGGAAVVLGALSPRTRNAQVAMYQEGDVDYLVATDAIGMGLNMDVEHVAFASTRKFDGHRFRHLTAAELAQTAGRAGRYTTDGTFGTTGDAGSLDIEVIERIENHEFDLHRQIYWRNPDVVTNTLEALKGSLRLPSMTNGLVRVREAADERALFELSRDHDVADMAVNPADVALLWDVCQIPDFEKEWTIGHARLLDRVYRHLMSGKGGLPTDWIADHVQRIDRADGDIDALSTRIGRIRTWTYISHKNDWLDDPLHWQGRTREIEDKLSDALHDRLTQRFVDKRTAMLASRLRDTETDLIAAIRSDGDVVVEGQYVGSMKGLRFLPDDARFASDRKTLASAAGRVLRSEVHRRISALESSAAEELDWQANGLVTWQGEAIARVHRGDALLRPRLDLLHNDYLESEDRNRLRKILDGWMRERIGTVLAPLLATSDADVQGGCRGLVYQLVEGVGSLPRVDAETQINVLTREDRKLLKSMGIRLGRTSIYIPALLKPAAVTMRANLWRAWHQPANPVETPPDGRITVELDPKGHYRTQKTFFNAIGYSVFREQGGSIAVRLDMVERIAGRAWSLGRGKPFALDETLMSFAGAGADRTAAILHGLGFTSREKEGVRLFRKPRPKRPGKPTPAKNEKTTGNAKPDPKKTHKKGSRGQSAPERDYSDSPFAVLKQLTEQT